MTHEDILRMAREAGIRIAGPMDSINPNNVYVHELERFAALVAAAEREACAKLVEESETRWLTLLAISIRARGQHE